MSDRRNKAVIVGAGPAGLTAAYELCKRGQAVTVLESDPQYVGGIARTVEYKGFRFDVGGHRFFSKSREVEDLWTEILGPDLLERRRSSRIYYRGQFYSYPLRPVEALRKLGLSESLLCVLSFLRAQTRPTIPAKSYEDWVVNQFGRRLFEIFFKSYTEKIWGMSCREISADWAAQRIKGLSLNSSIRNALRPASTRNRGPTVVRTLIDRFRYPRLGPGMMWEACAQKVRKLGGEIRLGRKVVHCKFGEADQFWTVSTRTPEGTVEDYRGDHLVSSMPIQELVSMIEPRLPDNALHSGASLRYRDFLTVGLIVRERKRLKDNWIYIHDPDVKVGRVQNYKSWSAEMVPDASFCGYGMEYFCFEGDGLWTATDAELVRTARKELAQLGFAKAEDVVDGFVIRQPKAYPVYDDDYKHHVQVVRQTLDLNFPTLHLAGRNGMHKYNNQDHAMATGLLTARNILAGRKKYDVWEVNEDASYHESDQRNE
jgi:protoporphyrinogen oxidase